MFVLNWLRVDSMVFSVPVGQYFGPVDCGRLNIIFYACHNTILDLAGKKSEKAALPNVFGYEQAKVDVAVL